MKSLNQSEDIDQNSSMIAMNENLLKDFKKTESLVDIPPNAELRNFNENDVLGDLDRDEKGNLVY
jgi:Zn-dependent M16 (insulinase) family peptidase